MRRFIADTFTLTGILVVFVPVMLTLFAASAIIGEWLTSA